MIFRPKIFVSAVTLEAHQCTLCTLTKTCRKPTYWKVELSPPLLHCMVRQIKEHEKSQSLKFNTESLTWATNALTTATNSQPLPLHNTPYTAQVVWMLSIKFEYAPCAFVTSEQHAGNSTLFDGWCQAICPCNLFLQLHLPVFVTALYLSNLVGLYNWSHFSFGQAIIIVWNSL